MRPYKLSPSALSQFRESPREFWLQRNRKITRPRGIVASLPNGIDRDLKKRFDICRDAGVQPPELFEQYPDHRILPDKGLMTELRNRLLVGRYVDNEGNELRGKLDDLVLNADDELVAFDFKSKSTKPDQEYCERYYGLQLDCYALMVEELVGNCLADGTVVKGVADYGLLGYYWPEHMDGELVTAFDSAQLTCGWGCEMFNLEVSPHHAKRIMTDAIDCLSGPMPGVGKGHGAAFDQWAVDYVDAVTRELVAATGD